MRDQSASPEQQPSTLRHRLRTAVPQLLLSALTTVAFVVIAGTLWLNSEQVLWLCSPLALAAMALAVAWWVQSGDDDPSAAPSAKGGRKTAPSSAAVPFNRDALQVELEQLRNVQAQLIQAKHDAESATMAKGEFLATMSHEIRTPLNGIIPLLDILLGTQLGVDQRDYLQTAYKSSRELLRIVDDILDYSKIEAKKVELESVGLNLKELAESVMRLLEKSAEAKGLKLTLQIDPGLRLAARGDPVRLRQILSNLVSNAIKFTQRGSVTIQIGKRGETRTQHEIMIAVKDTGVGLAPEAATKLFQPFSQADASTTRIHGGTGLGLVICKRLVELMQGKLGVKSELGKGSVFWFSVPLLKAIGDMSGARRELGGARAVILSGDAATVRRLSAHFSAWGVSVQHSTSAAETLAKLRSAAGMGETWANDLLVVDMGTLRSNGATLVKNILRETALDRLCLVLIRGDEEVPAELQAEVRALIIPRQYVEAELRGALQRLLDGGDSSGKPNLLRGAADDLPQVQIADPAGTPKVLNGHVLLVEDNPVNRQVAQRLLSLIGLSIVVAENGKEALDQIERGHFDAVLMDCQMPVMDGYSATRARRSREIQANLPRLPIIAMTANAMAGDREKCLNAGMDDYMSKPLNRALLEQTLRKWIGTGAVSQPTPSTKPALATRPTAPGQAPTPAPIAAVAAAPPPMVAHPRSAAPAAAEPAPTHAALDVEVIRDLLDVMGEEFTDLVRVYLEDTPKSLSSLEDAARRGDVDGLVAPSHSLKSTSANLGALALSEIAKRIEHGARSGNLGPPAVIVAQLHSEYRRVAAELNRLLVSSGA